jgi:predicted Zn-dependent peptidase
MFDKEISKHTHQTHCIIGSRAYGIEQKRKLPLSLAVNILGGPCANSRLNMIIREKYGLSYTIEANYTPYGDTGIVAIYFSSDHDNAERCSDLIYSEVKRVREVKLSTRQLSMAKKQFIAQLAISMEANEGYMLGVGKSFLCHREVDTLEEVYRKINQLTAMEIMEAANETFDSTSRLIYK